MRLAALAAFGVAAALTAQGQIIGVRPSRPGVPAASVPNIPAPPPIRGSLTTPDGQTFDTRYYFDHNALQLAVRSGRSIIAMTASGNLLRFDLATLEMTGESVVAGRATTLTAGDERHVLIGTEDGHIDRVEIDTWRRTPVGTGDGQIVWIGTSGNSVVAAVAASRGRKWWPGEPDKTYDERLLAGESNAKTRDAVLVIAGGTTRHLDAGTSKTYIPEATYGLDRDTLWIGNDGGEFGGSLHRMDLRTGAITPIEFSHNVRGFAIVSGALYAYGGLSHITMTEGYVSRLGSGPPADVVRFSNDKPVDPKRPAGPIDHLLPAPEGNGFLAVSDHELWRADRTLQSWTRITSIDGRWFAGARYAAANTPTLNSLILDPNHPRDLIAVMGRDGMVRVSSSGQSHRAFEGQLEIDAVDIWTTSVGTLLLPDIRQSPSAWTLGERGWDGTFFANAKPAGPEEWSEGAIAGDDGQGVILFCESPWLPGERAIFRVGRGRRSEVLDRWNGDADALGGWLLSPANQAVELAYGGGLRVRDRGGWLTVGTNAMPSEMDVLGRLLERRFSLLDRIDGVSYFHDNGRGFLAALTPQADGSQRLAPADGLGDRSAGIWDASPDGDHWILSASHSGLYRVHLPDGRAQRMADPNNGDEITTITRDRQGRIWAGGDAIYVSGDDGAHWTMLDLPMTGRGVTRRIRPNPDASRGVWISLGDRGFVIVR